MTDDKENELSARRGIVHRSIKMDTALNYTDITIKTRKQTVAFHTLQDPRHGREKHTKECPKRDVCGECRCRVVAECGRAIAGVTRDVVDGAIDGALFI